MLAEVAEIHPEAFLTTYVYVPAESPVIVLPVPAPVRVTPPGFLVRVHVPVDGNPLRTTVPVALLQSGWVIVPTTGVEGIGGCGFITTPDDVEEIHPAEFFTVKVYVPAGSPEIVLLVPVPVTDDPPGDRVRVQVPVEGRPFRTTLPVATLHVGWIIDPITGAVGVEGWTLITTLPDATELHPSEFFTVKV